MPEHYKTFYPKPKNTDALRESVAVSMKPAAACMDTELHKNTSSLCERWDGQLQRALRKTA